MNQLVQTINNAYDHIATHHKELVGGPFSTDYERPATIELLGDVAGKKVLDAGCGPGIFAALLVEKGATVLAFDSSPEMVSLAQQTLGDSATVMQADLNQPLDFIESAKFDVILSSLVLDYIEDWNSLLREFSRILTDNGRLVISIHHPFFMDLKNNREQIAIEKNYFRMQPVEENWAPTGRGIPSYRRPLSAIADTFWNTGFLIERMVEPKPSEAWQAIHAPSYEKWMEHPVILCISARKQ